MQGVCTAYVLVRFSVEENCAIVVKQAQVSVAILL